MDLENAVVEIDVGIRRQSSLAVQRRVEVGRFQHRLCVSHIHSAPLSSQSPLFSHFSSMRLPPHIPAYRRIFA